MISEKEIRKMLEYYSGRISRYIAILQISNTKEMIEELVKWHETEIKNSKMATAMLRLHGTLK